MAKTLATDTNTTPSDQMRAWAYLGAWELAIDILREFPGMLTHLQQHAQNGHAPAPPRYEVRRQLMDATAAVGRPVAKDGTQRGLHSHRGPYKKTQKPRRRMSMAERKAISRRMRARWALAREAVALRDKAARKATKQTKQATA